MADQKIKLVIQLRRDYASNWEKYKNTVPDQGEPCFVIDQNILKIGDGVTKFCDLEPINGANVELHGDGKSIMLEDGIFKLMGYDAAEVGAQPQKTADGIKWVMPVDLTDAVKTLQTDVETLQSSVETAQKDIVDLKDLVGTMDTSSGSLLDRIANIEKDVNTIINGVDKDKIDSLVDLIDYVDTHGANVTEMMSTINDLKAIVGEGSVDDRILVATEGKVDKVEGKGLSTNDFDDSLLAKLNGIEENAQVNLLENISIGGSLLEHVDKTIDIPFAGTEKAGVVKSATGANMVNVANDGTMSVKKISTRSIFMPLEDELILDGGGATKEVNKYAVRVGDMGCDNISDAVACAEYGDVIALQENVNLGDSDDDHIVSNSENVTIDLGGNMITANGSNGAIKVEGGMTTLDGAGVVNGTLGSDKYSMAVWCDNGTVVINDGTYRNETDGTSRGTDLIYASGSGRIEINGGVFEAAKPEWTLNVKDADWKAGTAKIIVKGGSFKGFDPSNNTAEGAHTNFVADGYKSVLDNGYYVVKPV